MTIEAFRQAVKGGCAMCSEEIGIGAGLRKEVSWVANSSGGFDWLCGSCTQPPISGQLAVSKDGDESAITVV
jgi:hypothetical protein